MRWRLHRRSAASRVYESMALNPRRLMLHVFLTSNFISTNILARSDVTTILLALPIPFRAHQDSPWPHPRDPGASRLASHESLHGATAVRAVRGARHGTISAWRRVESCWTPEDRDHERHQRNIAPLSKDQTKRLLKIQYSITKTAVGPQRRQR